MEKKQKKILFCYTICKKGGSKLVVRLLEFQVKVFSFRRRVDGLRHRNWLIIRGCVLSLVPARPVQPGAAKLSLMFTQPIGYISLI